MTEIMKLTNFDGHIQRHIGGYDLLLITSKVAANNQSLTTSTSAG